MSPAQAKVIYTDKCSEGLEHNLLVSKWHDDSGAGANAASSADANAAKNHNAIILLVHGLTQQPGSLNTLAGELASRGYLVFAITQRGHGEWHQPKYKNLKEYKFDIKGSEKDISKLATALKIKYSNIPLYTLGESLGASMILKSAVMTPNAVSGIILCSCGTKRAHYKWHWVLKDAICSVLNPFYKINLARYQLEYACENRAVVEETLKDPLARKSLSGIEILRANRQVRQNTKLAKKLSPNISLLVLQGSLDRVMQPNSAIKAFSQADVQQKAMVILAESGHMLIGRPDISPLLVNSVDTWIKNHSNASTIASREGADISRQGTDSSR